MIQRVSVNPGQIKDYTCLTLNIPGRLNSFPFLSIDKDSYIVGLEVQSGIDFDPVGGRHCIALGKGCSLAESITFMMDLNHDYSSVAQGELAFLQGVSRPNWIARKGTILIQNDVWIGHGAFVMSGVTLHNGCVVAANAVVTKDVPPYAIVGGNPAKIIRYRFEADMVDALQKISWWDWPDHICQARKQDFSLSVPEFIAKYLPEAEQDFRTYPPRSDTSQNKTILLIPDVSQPYPLYPKIFDEFFAMDRPETELLIYLSKQDSTPANLQIIEEILQKYEKRECNVILQTGETIDESILFQCADYFVTTRDRQTIYRSCLADRFQVGVLYGTDMPVFPI